METCAAWFPFYHLISIVLIFTGDPSNFEIIPRVIVATDSKQTKLPASPHTRCEHTMK